MKRVFAFLFIILSTQCARKETPLPEEKAKPPNLTGNLSTYGPVITITNEKLSPFNVHYFTVSEEKGKLVIFKPTENLILEEKENRNLHYFHIKPSMELTVFQLFSQTKELNKTIVKITIPSSTPYKFAVYGGFIKDREAYKLLCKLLGKNLPIFVIHTGNLVENSFDLTQWSEFFNNAGDFMVNSVFIPSLNEKELQSDVFRNAFCIDERSFLYYKYPSLRVFVLNTSMDFHKGSSRYEWLEKELSTATLEWKIVILDKSPFSSINDKRLRMINEVLIPLFEKYKVNLIISGDIQGYERYIKNNITYIRSANELNTLEPYRENPYLLKSIKEHHFILIEVSQKRMIGRVYNLSNEQIDEFQIIE